MSPLLNRCRVTTSTDSVEVVEDWEQIPQCKRPQPGEGLARINTLKVNNFVVSKDQRMKIRLTVQIKEFYRRRC